MLKNKLQYLMSDNPEETISQKGSDIRKKIRPLFMKVLKLGNKLDLIVEKNDFIKTSDRPIIYVASHGFKDDVLNTILTIKDDAYIVFGNIDLFYNTFDGLCLWIYGAQLVDRYNRSSKHAMKEKMNKIIEYKNNVVIFSEATWNLSPNKPMENLHWGFYDVAVKNNALIVPVITNKVGKKCYSRVLESIDLNNIKEEDINSIYLLMKKYINKAIDLNIYKSKPAAEINNELNNLSLVIEKLKDFKDAPKSKYVISAIQIMSNKIVRIIDKLKLQVSEDSELELSTFNLISRLISRVGFAEKEIMVNKVRDLMASEKYDMYEKHPDYSYMTNGKDTYKAWEDYLRDTISATPYFYLEPEKTTLCKDPLISSEEEVMPWLSSKPKVKSLNKY